MTASPTREDALKALDKLYSLIREGNYMLAENPRNVLEAYIKNTPYEPLAVEQSAEAAKEQPVKVGRGSAIVIDRDKVPKGLKEAVEIYKSQPEVPTEESGEEFMHAWFDYKQKFGTDPEDAIHAAAALLAEKSEG